MELLEKRTKSRFSNQQILLLTDFTFEEYQLLFKSLLSVEEGEERKEEGEGEGKGGRGGKTRKLPTDRKPNQRRCR